MPYYNDRVQIHNTKIVKSRIVAILTHLIDTRLPQYPEWDRADTVPTIMKWNPRGARPTLLPLQRRDYRTFAMIVLRLASS
jgi:hypothetical protein